MKDFSDFWEQYENFEGSEEKLAYLAYEFGRIEGKEEERLKWQSVATMNVKLHARISELLKELEGRKC